MYALMAVVFVIGYLCIAFEHPLKIDKAAAAILTAVLTWTILVLGADHILPLLQHGSHDPADSSAVVVEALRHHLGEVSEILFFLLGAMTIVELIDSHEGFKAITDRIQTRKRVHLLWIVGFLTFFLSAALDNLTTTIVMVSLLRKLIRGRPERWLFVGVVVIAANSGGAWSPIGDVTTTMLWIGNQITASGVIVNLFLPSLVCLLVPLIILSFTLRGEAPRPRPRAHLAEKHPPTTTVFERNLVLGLGLAALLFVPIFKTVTHLPPYMGILFGLGVLWVTTEFIHRNKNAEDKHPLSVVGVLRKVDTPSVLFFLGILLLVGMLKEIRVLDGLVHIYDQVPAVMANYLMGVMSAAIDNVPLTAALLKSGLEMGVAEWMVLTYAVGVGGSLLVIGSASGIVAMSKVPGLTFGSYLRHMLYLFVAFNIGFAGVYLIGLSIG